MTDRPRIVVNDERGRPAASAVIDDINYAVARASLRMEPGQHAPDTRARLVDAVIDALAERPDRRLQVNLPLGDHELLAQVRRRCPSHDVRVAGSTCLAEVHLPDPRH